MTAIRAEWSLGAKERIAIPTYSTITAPARSPTSASSKWGRVYPSTGLSANNLAAAVNAVGHPRTGKITARWSAAPVSWAVAARKLSLGDLWEMYRNPPSLFALIPVSITIQALREQIADGDAEGTALRFAEAIARELEECGSLHDVALSFVFEGDLVPIDPVFYRERLASYAGTNRKAPQYQDLAAFVRQTFSDNLVIPLCRLVALHQQGHVPLPAALLKKHQALINAAVPPSRDHLLETKAPVASATSTPQNLKRQLQKIDNFDEVVQILFRLHIDNRSITARNVKDILRQHGYDVTVPTAQKALSRVKGAGPGRPPKCHDKK